MGPPFFVTGEVAYMLLERVWVTLESEEDETAKML